MKRGGLCQRFNIRRSAVAFGCIMDSHTGVHGWCGMMLRSHRYCQVGYVTGIDIVHTELYVILRSTVGRIKKWCSSSRNR